MKAIKQIYRTDHVMTDFMKNKRSINSSMAWSQFGPEQPMDTTPFVPCAVLWTKP